MENMSGIGAQGWLISAGEMGRKSGAAVRIASSPQQSRVRWQVHDSPAQAFAIGAGAGAQARLVLQGVLRALVDHV